MDKFKQRCEEEIARLGISQTSKIIPKKKFESLLGVWKDDLKDKALRSHIKLKGYKLINLPDLGLKDVLAIPKGKLFLFMHLYLTRSNGSHGEAMTKNCVMLNCLPSS